MLTLCNINVICGVVETEFTYKIYLLYWDKSKIYYKHKLI